MYMYEVHDLRRLRIEQCSQAIHVEPRVPPSPHVCIVCLFKMHHHTCTAVSAHVGAADALLLVERPCRCLPDNRRARLQVACIVKGKAASAVALLGMDGTTVSAVGVGTAAVTAEGVPEEHLTDALCGQLGYPYDLVVPGMLAHNMLEFSVDAQTGEVRLKLMTNWRRAAGLVDSSGGTLACGGPQVLVNALWRT